MKLKALLLLSCSFAGSSLAPVWAHDSSAPDPDYFNLQRKGLPEHAYTKASILAAPCRLRSNNWGSNDLSGNLAKFGFQISAEGKAFQNPAVRRDVVNAIAALPEHLIAVARRNPIQIHFSSKRGPGHALAETLSRPNQNPVTTFYIDWERGKYNVKRQGLFVHEFGHAIAYQLRLDDSPDWLEAAGWSVDKARDKKVSLNDCKRTGVCRCIHSDRILSANGATDPLEDFAETFAAYRLNPRMLEKQSPEKYRYMKTKVFNNIEYKLEDVCSTGA